MNLVFAGVEWRLFILIMKYLVVGLGNIGAEYARTRHNIGFMILDTLAAKAGISFESARYADMANFRYKGRQIILIKPSTYMNLSGKAVNYWMQKENIPIENIFVLTDDIALPLGTIRIRAKGSDGGHNGLSHIIETIGSNVFARLRFGIGSDFAKGHQVNFVLSEWTKEETALISPKLITCADAIKSFCTAGLNMTMNTYNSK